VNEEMKLIEGMKKLRVLEKKIARNTERISQYASAPSNEKPTFGTEQEQKKQVKELVQANVDLTTEYLNLKQRVDMTNLTTVVNIGKRTYKLSDLLVLRRGLAKLMEKTWHSLSTEYGDRRLSSMRGNVVLQAGEKQPFVVKIYDENDKFEQLQDWQSLQDEIEQRLEVINATTQLVTLPLMPNP
jgi:regulator of replication initiation timing